MKIERTCIVCQRIYLTSWLGKYCSNECRRILAREKSREKNNYKEMQKTCLCGKNFTTYRKRQIYCSNECLKKFINSNKEKQNILGLRFEILIRDKFTCQYCGRTPQQGILLHVDHIKPKSKFGENIKENLVTACEECNLGKGEKEYFGEILTYLKNKNFEIRAKLERR